MDDDLRMRLADLGSPEALAQCIADHFPGLRIPVPIEDIARAVGIDEINGIRTSSFEGVLVTDEAKSKGSIAFNLNSRLERQRFTIAHEIGHFLIVTHNHNAQCAKADLSVVSSADARRSKEAEANRFAACMLMPRRQFVADMRKLGPVEVEHIVKLADKFQVSKEAAARRLSDLSDVDCAIIFSLDGRVRGFCKSPSFPFLAVKASDPLPANSTSRSAKLNPGSASTWSERLTEIWLGRDMRGKVIYEQFLQQANGFGITLLTLDSKEEEYSQDEEVDDEDDVSQAWRPPTFRR